MKKQAEIKVEDNHKRAISAALSSLDEVLCEFDRIAVGQQNRSVMYAEKNGLTAAQRARLRATMAEMRAIISRIKEELALEPKETDLASRIWSSASSFWEVLIETKSGYLKGYGAVPRPLADFLDPEIEKLVGLLTKIVELTHK